MTPVRATIPPEQSPASVEPIVRSIVDAIPLPALAFDVRLTVLYRNNLATVALDPVDDAAALLEHTVDPGDAVHWRSELVSVLQSGLRGQFEMGSRANEPTHGRNSVVTVTALPMGAGDPCGIGLLVFGAPHGHHPDSAAPSPLDGSSSNLVARVAHELNNPLDGILRYLNLAKRVIEAGQSAQALEYLGHCRDGLNRMTQITGQLLVYSRGATGHPHCKPIDEVVEEVIRSVQSRATESGVVITANYRTHSRHTIAGPELFQVCANLFKNALDAMPDGGMLTVTVAETGDHVVLHVEDTGAGLPDPSERIFEPFFTTKQDNGTGLGLAICRDFIERLGGTITAANRPQRGATFTVRFPLDQNRTDGTAQPDSNGRRPQS